MRSKRTAATVGIGLVLLASVAIWRFALFVTNNFDADHIVSRLGFALIVSSLTILLVMVLYRGKKSKAKLRLLRRWKGFFVGALWYSVPALIGVVFASLLGFIEVSVNYSLVNTVGAVFLTAWLVLLSEAIPEEIIFRGYILSKLSILNSRWLRIFIQAALFTVFAFMIGALSGTLDASFIFTFGVVLGILRLATGSVSAAIGFHLACMTFQQSFSAQWSPFTTTDSFLLQTFIFGMIPISITIAYYATKVAKANTKSPQAVS